MLLLSSCVISQESPAPSSHADDATTLFYQCPEEINIPVQIRDHAAWIFYPGSTFQLPQVPSGSGSKFSDGHKTYWTQGDSALFEIDGLTIKQCRNNRALAAWEHAKLSGADFRGLGNEPGWVLEIYPQRIELTTLYGEEFISVPFDNITQTTRSLSTKYQSKHPLDLITIELYQGACHDTMSGEKFATSVRILYNATVLRGCGNPLP